MDLNRLRYFCTVSDTGSLRAAAEILHLSPAALSKSIKLLEAELDMRLLVPSGRGILVTDAGQKLAMRARSIFQQIDAFEASLREGQWEGRPLYLGSFEVFTTYFLGPLMRDYLEEYSLVLHELVPGFLETAISERRVDVGVTYIPIPSEDLDHLPVTRIEMGIFGQKKFKEVAFEKLPFVIPVSPVSGSPNRVRGLDGWPERRVKRHIRFRVALMESALELCRIGVAVGYFPKFVVRLHNNKVRSEHQLVPLPIPEGVGTSSQQVYLVKRRSDSESPVTKKLASALRVLTKEEP